MRARGITQTSKTRVLLTVGNTVDFDLYRASFVLPSYTSACHTLILQQRERMKVGVGRGT